MLLCSVAHLVQRFRGEILFQLDQFEIHTGDKIGLIGANGCGKTTLLKLLARECEPDQGVIINPVPIRFFHQQPLPEEITPSLSIKSQDQQTAARLQAFFTQPAALAFLDEPTTHLDLPSRQTFEAQLATLDSFILVSHDQQLLRQFCTRIVEIRNHQILVWAMTFDHWLLEKENQRRRQQREYEKRTKKKAQLLRAAEQKERQAAKLNRKPKRMNSREFRLRRFIATRKSFDGKQKAMRKTVAHLQARIASLPPAEKPKVLPVMKLDLLINPPPQAKVLVEAEMFSCGYPGRPLLHQASFRILNFTRTAIIGPNGCGKSKLARLIADRAEGLRFAPGVRPGLLDQQLDLLNPDETILQNALRLSVQKEEVIRTVLSRMLFPQDTLNKKAAVLSSGERVRLALVCLFCSACNMLILDEPTHYLDLPSIQALTQLLQTAGQCVILISHDPALIRQTCTQLLRFENQKLISLAVEDWSTTRTSKPPLEKTILQMRLISLEEALRQQPENPALQDQRDALIVQLRQFI